MEDNLDEIIESIGESIKNELEDFLNNNPDWVNYDCPTEDIGKYDIPDFHSDLDYNGAVHDIIDSAVPTNTKNIKDLWYLYGDDFEHAFDNAGIGEKNDDNWPSGWKPAAIYTYLEQKAYGWYEDNAPEIAQNYISKKKKELVQSKLSEIKEEEESQEY